jgi:hypothetical protein
MALAMTTDEPAAPVGAGLFGRDATVPEMGPSGHVTEGFALPGLPKWVSAVDLT